MRSLRSLLVYLSLAVPAVAADLEIMAPDEPIQPGQHYLLEVHGLTTEDLPTSQILVEPAVSTKAVGVTGWAGEQYLWFVASEKGRAFVAVVVVRGGLPVSASVVIEIGDPEPPPPPPPPPDSEITKEAVRRWLDNVPLSAREEMITNPVTSEKFTRQEAVGRTFIEVGKVAKDLRSIPAANVMLTTGLVAAFGSRASQWRPFAVLADAALAAAEKRGISAADYGKVLSVIGGALQ